MEALVWAEVVRDVGKPPVSTSSLLWSPRTFLAMQNPFYCEAVDSKGVAGAL